MLIVRYDTYWLPTCLEVLLMGRKTDESVHGGLSSAGKSIIQEMNRLGVYDFAFKQQSRIYANDVLSEWLISPM